LVNASGRTVGDAYMEESPNGVLIKVDLREAEPGIHGFHIHEKGRCEAPTFESAGDHFAPGGNEHGFLSADGPHAGDLPNAHVLVSGATSFEHFLEGVTLRPGERSLLDADGSALVMHGDADDYRTDPGGKSGDRIACGVIMR
jgi:Cu-Zn family superoxide dismutase